MDRTIEILQHKILYWYTDDQEMPEHEEDRLKDMIADGYSSGELIDGDNRGWWTIKRD